MDLGYQWSCNSDLPDGQKCRAPIRAGKKFCKKCGAQAGPPLCPTCGSPLDGPEDVFCGECGVKIEGVFQQSTSRNSSVVSYSGEQVDGFKLPRTISPPAADGSILIVDPVYGGSDVSVSSSISQKQPNIPSQPPDIAYQPPSIPSQPPNIAYQPPSIPSQPPNIAYQPLNILSQQQMPSQVLPPHGLFQPQPPVPQMLTPEQFQVYLMQMSQYGHPSQMQIPGPYMQMPGPMDARGSMITPPSSTPDPVLTPGNIPEVMPGMMPTQMSFHQQPVDSFHQPFDAFHRPVAAADNSQMSTPGMGNSQMSTPGMGNTQMTTPGMDKDMSEEPMDTSSDISPYEEVDLPQNDNKQENIDRKVEGREVFEVSEGALQKPEGPIDESSTQSTEPQPEELTNRSIFGSIPHTRGEKSSGSMVFGQSDSLGGGDSNRPIGKNEALYASQDELRNRSKDLIKTAMDQSQEMKKMSGDSGKEGSDDKEGNNTGRRSPFEEALSQRSPKREAEIDEVDEQFKKLRRLDDPESEDMQVHGENMPSTAPSETTQHQAQRRTTLARPGIKAAEAKDAPAEDRKSDNDGGPEDENLIVVLNSSLEEKAANEKERQIRDGEGMEAGSPDLDESRHSAVDEVVFVQEVTSSDKPEATSTDGPDHPLQHQQAYMKPDAAEEFVLAGKRKNKKKTRQQQNSTTPNRVLRGQDENQFTVCFYAIIDPEFKCREKKSFVAIRFDHPYLGGWDDKGHKMHVERKLDKGYDLLSCRVTMPLSIAGLGLQYKYSVIRDDDNKWELLKTKFGYPTNRQLHLDKIQLQNNANMMRYDGIIVKEKRRGVLSKISGFFTGTDESEVLNLTVDHMIHVMEQRCDQHKTGSQVVQEIRAFNVSSVSWPQFDQQKRFQSVMEAVHNLLKRRIAELVKQEGPESPEDASRRLGLAMAYTRVMMMVNVQLARQELRTLCEALLMKHTENQDCPEFADLFLTHFPGDERIVLANFLITLMVKVTSAHKDEPCWLFCVPLLHFLTECCEPFSLPRVCYQVNHETEGWWGINKIKKMVEDFKIHYKNVEPNKLKNLLQKLSAYYSMDPLLPRTILASLNHCHLQVILTDVNLPLDAVLGMIHFHVKTYKIQVEDMKGIVAELAKNVSVLEKKCIEDKSIVDEGRLQSYKSAASVCIDLLNLVNVTEYRAEGIHEIVPALLGLTMSVVQVRNMMSATYQELHPDYTDPSQATKRDFKGGATNVALKWFTKWLPCRMGNTKIWYNAGQTFEYFQPINACEIDAWSNMFHVKVLDEENTQWWHDQLHQRLTQRLNEIRHHVLDVYCYHIKNDQHHPKLVQCVTDLTFTAAKESFMNAKYHHGRYFDKDIFRRIGPIFSRVFLENWPKDRRGQPTTDEKKMLEHSLTMPSFARFLEFLGDENATDILSDDCVQFLACSISQHTAALKHLAQGSLTIDRLRLLLGKKKSFVENVESVKTIWISEIPDCDVLRLILDARNAELMALENLRRDINELLAICEGIPDVEYQVLEKKCSARLDDRLLNSVCIPIVYDVSKKMASRETPQITFFELSQEIEKAMPEILKLKDCLVFKSIFTGMAERTNRVRLNDNMAGLTIQDIAAKIWPKAEAKWKTLCRKMCDGSITLRETDSHFEPYYRKEQILKSEIKFLCMGEENELLVSERLEEIRRYHQLEECKEGAHILLAAKDKLELTGDFSILEHILGATQEKSSPLISMTRDILEVSDAIKNFTKERQRCLSCYISCQPLVQWLRINVPKAQELKALVDLALIAATGKGDLEVTKVSCLHAAVSGFTPLIYDLGPDAGFHQFYKQCQAIWPTLASDPNLDKKLMDINNDLTWLKNVKDAQGDVEVNALKQVAAINSSGVYFVASGTNKSSTPMTVDDMVHVEVKGERYSLSNLKELQSKLMLVAGKAEKGKEGVDKFVEIFDGVTSLANTFIKICTAGSILFKDWSAKFYCDQDKKVNAIVDFGLYKGKLAGRCEEASVTQQIMQIRDFMESCLDEWKAYITEQRSTYPELNYYTTEQLVILRSELTCLTSGQKSPTEKVFALLNDICPQCTFKTLKAAFRDAIAQIKEQESHKVGDEEMGVDGGSGESMEEVSDDDSEPQRSIRLLMNQGYQRKLVEYVISKYGLEDIDQLEWRCQDLEEEQKLPEMEGTEEADVEIEDSSILQCDKTLQKSTTSYLAELSSQKSTLSKKLEDLWSMFLGSASLSVADYLSVQHLGIILQKLSQKQPLTRCLPPYLRQGHPNLIVCPKNEIFVHVLSAYMENKHLPMPRREEVLLCTESTSLEEVELLIWRAVQDRSGRIFILVFAEQLGYEVGGQVERAMERHMQGHSEYRFVVVCAAEKQDKSALVAALENHRVHNPVPQSPDQVKQYIHYHLTSDGDNIGYFDPESCTVRVVRSDRAGEGKSLWVKQRKLWLSHKDGVSITLPLHGNTASVLYVLNTLLEHGLPQDNQAIRLIHIDIPHEMQDGVDHLLFNLVILGSLVDHVGYIWQRSENEYYVIEIMPLEKWEIGDGARGEAHQAVHQVLDLLPTVTCRSPEESLSVLRNQNNNADYRPGLAMWSQHDQLMDLQQFVSVPVQRVYQYLTQLSVGGNLRDVNPSHTQGSVVKCIEVLLRYCGLENPSWAELVHFVNFLNLQLETCENSSFCTIAATSDDTLPGFLQFVVRFMIQMSKDFSTRSLVMAEESPGEDMTDITDNDQVNDDKEINQFQLKRRWETSPHPYIFFNPDGATMTFLGFIVQRPTYDIIDAETKTVLERRIMSQVLFNGLSLNGVNLHEQFDKLSREEKISKLCMVMGINRTHEPDPKYVLTTDNVKKILAIQMRFRCGIPVVIMGETGCGKTQLIKFMCKLQNPPGTNVKNMILMKVHGGTTEDDIIRKVRAAEKLACENRNQFPNMYTVLFLDEVNTTEALGLVKEVLCDLTLKGKPLNTNSGLKLIAACNPYRKHSKEVIEMLERAGLGYHVSADETRDKLGRIPMRRLVYRVQPLPQSMLPLVWDFGQLGSSVEKMYISKIVQKKAMTMIEFRNGELEIITNILVACQEYMRHQQDECSFVSLRDVERTMEVMNWFYNQEELFRYMDTHKQNQLDDEARQRLESRRRIHDPDVEDMEDDEQEVEDIYDPPDDLCRALVLAIGVCYHACLQEQREDFREHISSFFTGELELEDGPQTFLENISLCQDVILNEVELGPNIARNQALKENVFMMVVCIELRIPLFLVGKPGSSKSLARTIVVDSMQGPQSKSQLFKQFKEVTMVSYQCSPLSTPDGIVNTFQQCAQLQKDMKDLDKFVAVVVLDEVGLAEDSPRMPLKTLHPLLEDGCQEDEEGGKHKKVGFIGISNWALDPAKMNRGILVQRGPPDEAELRDTAKDICSSNPVILNRISKLMTPLARAYSELYKSAIKEIREFFGLRDFYSLVKMVHGFSEKNHNMPTWRQLEHAILRNFGGLDRLGPVKVFGDHLHSLDKNGPPLPGDPDNSPSGLLRASLCGDGLNYESRYMLLLTENYAALTILMQNLEDMQDAIIIFGSSFPKDQEYTVVCRNINRIKVCMETGQTVILLNLENLYESLYDALNQNYTYFGGQRHVDLGLGGHRVKSRVHENFKLIVVAEKEVVYKKFPIPLINRLEKHFLAMSTELTEEQLNIVKELECWARSFSRPLVGPSRNKQSIGDSFIGYQQDTCASVVLQVCHQMEQNDGDTAWGQKVLKLAQAQLLWCATPESVIRIKKTQLVNQEKEISDIYFNHQQHGSLTDFLQSRITDNQANSDAFIQVTTHSRILSNKGVVEIAQNLHLPNSAVNSQSIHAFNTEQQFSKLFRSYFAMESETSQIMIIQCDSGDQNAELIACARYIIWDEYKQVEHSRKLSVPTPRKHVILIIQLPRVTGGCFTGFEGGKWQSVHLDDLRITSYKTPSIEVLKKHTISALIGTALHAQPEPITLHEPEPVEEAMVTDTGEAMDMMEGDGGGTSQVATDDSIEVGDVLGVHLDFNHLVRRCIHGAASMVKDQVDMGSSTTRITKLFTLFSLDKAKGKDFSETMKNRVHMLLRDKEDTHMTPDMASNWLVNDAASQDVINKAGTFRRAISLCLEMKITPMLAGLIAYIDTNNNLDIVTSGKAPEWKTDMWLRVFRDPAISPLTYGDLLSAKRNMELAEMTVRMFGAEGTRMDGTLPFSWLIKLQVDILVDQKRRAFGEEGLTESVGLLLKETAMWPVLAEAMKEAGTEVFTVCYIDDLVQMVYRPQTPNTEAEYELVKRAIRSTVNRLRKIEGHNRQTEQAEWDDEDYGMDVEDDKSEDGMDIDLPEIKPEDILPMMHVAEAAIHNRLQLFSQVALCCPEVIQEVSDFYENKAALPLATTSEMTLDILTVHLVVDKLKPNPKLLKQKAENKKWHEQIEKLGPLVNDVLARSRHIEDSGVGYYGRVCSKNLEDIRLNWNRVMTVKLFADIVCPIGSDQEKNVTKTCPILWRKLGDANFKKAETMKSIEEFLIMTTKMASEQYAGDMRQCNMCEEVLVNIVVLPCQHKVCPDCLEQLQDSKDFTCPECRVQYSNKAKLTRKEGNRHQIEKMREFKRRCNSFLMEVVSRLCFAGDTPPEAGVVEMLMNYITNQRAQQGKQAPAKTRLHTKQMSLFNENLDPTPVIRSVLLQLLLRSSVDDVRKHLVRYFDHAEQFMTEGDSIELAILYVQCLEDHYHNGMSKNLQNVTQRTTQLLKQCQEDLQDVQDKVTKLEGIAKLRYSLSVTARLMHGRSSVNIDPGMLNDLFINARTICADENKLLPGLYLIRLLVRHYGMDTLYEVAAERHLTWVMPEYVRPQNDGVRPDILVVCGPVYQEMRQTLARTLINCANIQPLRQIINDMGRHKIIQMQGLLLSLFSEITVKYNENERPTDQAIDAVRKAIQEPHNVELEELAEALITNTVASHCPELTVSPNTSRPQLTIIEIVTHFGIVMSTVTENAGLRPFHGLMSNPEAMRDIFLPTMPEDVRAAMLKALLDGRRIRGFENENPSLYECPNGHPYIIGNCGRPYFERRCYQCGEIIGGSQHQLRAGRRVDTIQDATRPGHVLGDPDQRSLEPSTERELTPASLSLLRLLLHLSLYTGANNHPQAIGNLIHGNMGTNTVSMFLWRHIECDLEVISKSVGKGKDDCAVLIHLLINELASKTVRCGNDGILTTKIKRNEWEKNFAASYIAPLLNELDTRLQQANHTIANDQRLESSPLLKMIHETGDQGEQQAAAGLDQLEQLPAMWRYRTRVTVEHLAQKLKEKTGGRGKKAKTHQLLRLFLQRETELRVVQLLPRILRLIRKLSQRYHRKIDRAEADTLKVKDFLHSLRHGAQREECEELFADFCTAWKVVHTHLSTHVISDTVLPADYANIEINRETPLSTLLPSLRGRGLCSIALLHYLTSVHNNFLSDYSMISKKKLDYEVSFLDLTSAHLVTYDLNRDFLPLVLANCTYSLEVGHGTSIEYNFASLEQQLEERYLRSAAPVAFQLEPVVFLEDMTNAILFTKLEKKIPQVALTPAMKAQIRADLRYIMEVTDCLSKLDITIGFLVSVGGDPNTQLQAFMTDTLRMGEACLSPKARQHCKLQHTRSLWLLLSHEREKMAARYKQEPFTSVDAANYKVPLTDEQKNSLESVLKHMNVDIFLSDLYECIIMQLTIKRNANEEDFVDNRHQKLNEALYGYIESRELPEIPALMGGAFPDITVEQCVDAWRAAYAFSMSQYQRI